MEFKDRLKDLRTAHNLSQTGLANELSLSKSAISMYETGSRTPDIDTLEKIADYFNVDIDYLIGKESGSTYYIDPQTAELAQELFQRPELRVLFDASKNASREDILTVSDILKRLKGDSHDDY